MKKYSLVKEEKDHFVIGHPKDGEFKVAKKGINKLLQKKIQGLPKGYAGEDENPQDQVVQEDNNTTENSPEVNPFSLSSLGSQAWNATKQAAKAGGNLALNTMTGKEDQSTKNTDLKNVSWEPIEGMQNKPIEGPQPEQQQTQVAPAIKEQPNYLDKWFGLEQQGINQGIASSDRALKATNDAIQENNLIQQEQFNNHQQNIKDWQASQDKLTQDFNDQKIDPKAVWHKADTPNKIAAGIGILLGGLSQGLIGGPNQAMAIINKTMDNDIEAQKAELGKKKNLLSINLQKYGDLQTAYAETRAQQISSLQSQLQQIAATSQNGQVRANAQKELAGLEMQKGQMGMQIAQNMMWRDVASGKTPITPQQLNMIPETHKDLKESAVVIPGEQMAYFAKDPATAKIANESIRAASDLDSALKQTEGFQRTIGTTYNPWSADSKQGDRLQKELQLKFSNFMEVNGKAMTPEQREEFSKVTANPSAFLQTNASNSYKNIRNIMNGTLDSTLKNTVPTYAAPKFRSQEMPGVSK